MKRLGFIPINISIGIVALLVLSGMAIYILSAPASVNKPAQKLIQPVGDSSNNQSPPAPSVAERYLELDIPVTLNQSVCLGSDLPIRWRTIGPNTVNVSVYNAGGFYRIGNFLATSNESGEPGMGDINWKVGYIKGQLTVPAGFGYKIYVEGTDERNPRLGYQVDDRTKDFTITDCRG